MFERNSADAVRYWAGSARLGVDATFDEQQMRIGRRLAIKILNASKFVLSMGAEPGRVDDPLDRSFLAALRRVVSDATAALDDYEHSRALDVTERSFWGFTDDYLELVKQRAYGVYGDDRAGSAVGALRVALGVFLRLFAPFLPYATEEAWSWWRDGSVHRAAWPTPEDLGQAADADQRAFELAAAVLGEVRREKTIHRVSLRAPVERVVVRDDAARLGLLDAVVGDLRQAGNIAALETVEDGEFAVETTLASA
jgi:valyl-tRNA synthetase